METGGKVEEHVQLIASLTKLKTLALGSFDYPPTPAFAKAGAAPGTTAGVELLLLRFPRSNLSCSHQATSIASAKPLKSVQPLKR